MFNVYLPQNHSFSAANGGHLVLGGRPSAYHQSGFGVARVIFLVQADHAGALPRETLAENGSCTARSLRINNQLEELQMSLKVGTCIS